MKRSVILTDRLGRDILSAFWTKGQVLHGERAHLKVPGFSIVLNVLLTRKLPTFLSRLNEISGGCEKIAPVSGSFCSILKLLRIEIASKPVARHFNLPNHFKEHMSICGLSLHQGTTDSHKNLEQRFIFQIGTLNPHGINERFSFN